MNQGTGQRSSRQKPPLYYGKRNTVGTLSTFARLFLSKQRAETENLAKIDGREKMFALLILIIEGGSAFRSILLNGP